MKQLPPTELPNPHTTRLDTLSPIRLVRVFNTEDFHAAQAVKKAHKQLAAVIVTAARAYATGHKIIFIGAGTSGRLGVLEAAECVPTFGVNPSQIIALIAGGKRAVFRSQEGAEDHALQGAKEIAQKATKKDLVIGLAASGNTPYVQGALKQARRLGASTVLISCNPQADTTFVQTHVYLPTGPEALAGSTRLKAGTATKMALNAITTGAMVLCGKTYHNLMIDVQPTNQKLLARAIRLVGTVAQTDEKTARKLLLGANKNVKTAIVMHRKQCTRCQAVRRLKKAAGVLAEALDE